MRTDEERLAVILSRCLDLIAEGETVAACLAQYPQQSRELAPLLAMAGELSELQAHRLSGAARQRTRARILEAESTRSRRPTPAGRWLPGLGMPRLATGFLVALLCVALTSALVAASQPGDLAYGVRLAVERTPALLARDPEARARAELGIVTRRIGDLDRVRQSQDDGVDNRTVKALLASMDAAANLAAGLPEASRAELTALLMEQAMELSQLERLAQGAAGGPELSEASQGAQAIVARLRSTDPRLRPTPTIAPHATPTAIRTPAQERFGSPTALASGHATPARLRYGAPTSAPEQRRTAQPTRTATPAGGRPGSTRERPAASATPRGYASATPTGPGPNATPAGPQSGVTPQGPGPGPSATAQGPGPQPSATPQGPSPRPSSTPQGPGADVTPAGPGATSQGPGTTATPSGPGSKDTPRSAGPSATPSGPRSCPMARP